MPDRSTFLAWSKTIQGIRFRAFAFTEGCGRDDCDACRAAAAEGSPPVWAVYVQPRPDLDEWCLGMVAYGFFEGEDGKRKLEEAAAKLVLDGETPREEWCKLAALIGTQWTVVRADPFTIAREQKEASDEFMAGGGLLEKIFQHAEEEELRQVRISHREGGKPFGEAFGSLWAQLVKRFRRGT